MRIKTDEKRREILQAAAVEFSERGFHKTTLAHVAARMSSSKATIYNYFTSKGELFGSMLAESAQPATASLLRAFEQDIPFDRKLAAFVHAYVKMQSSDISIAIQRLLVAEHDNKSVSRPLHDNQSLNVSTHLARIFTDEQQLGMLRQGNPEEMTTQLLALMHGDLPIRMLFGDGDSVTEADKQASADSTVRIFLLAYGAR